MVDVRRSSDLREREVKEVKDVDREVKVKAVVLRAMLPMAMLKTVNVVNEEDRLRLKDRTKCYVNVLIRLRLNREHSDSY